MNLPDHIYNYIMQVSDIDQFISKIIKISDKNVYK